MLFGIHAITMKKLQEQAQEAQKKAGNLQKQIGIKVRSLRIERGMTIEELAAKADLNAAYLGRLERGEQNMEIQTLEKISAALGAAPTEFLERRAADRLPTHKEKLKDQLFRMLRTYDAPTLEMATTVLKDALSWGRRYRGADKAKSK